MPQAQSRPQSYSLQFLRPEVARLKERLDRFVDEECIPAEAEFHAHLQGRYGEDRWTPEAIPPCLERLKKRAQTLGFWNLFVPPRLIPHLPDPSLGPSITLTYREYGILCETLGRCPTLAPEACNTSAPDTGNMEVLLEFGTQQQKQDYLIPLLRGEIRSAFLMTEPDVASSDPTNLATTLTKKVASNGTVEYNLNGRKWWSTGAMDPRCRMALVVSRMDYDNDGAIPTTTTHQSSAVVSQHGAHTIVLVPMPHPGVVVERALTVFGYDDAPHGHSQVRLDQVRLTAENLIAGEGEGFAVSQARLGPGRIDHCMRAIGMGKWNRFGIRPTAFLLFVSVDLPTFFLRTAARCYEMMLQRSMERQVFGKFIWEHGSCQEMIAESVSDLSAARLLTLSCAAALDDLGPRNARDQIATIKVAVPAMTYRVVDRAVQVFGGAGVSDDFVLAQILAGLRTLRIADGPDAVHSRTVARLQIHKAKKEMEARKKSGSLSRL